MKKQTINHVTGILIGVMMVQLLSKVAQLLMRGPGGYLVWVQLVLYGLILGLSGWLYRVQCNQRHYFFLSILGGVGLCHSLMYVLGC